MQTERINLEPLPPDGTLFLFLQVQQRWTLLAGASDAALLGVVGGTSPLLDRPQPHHHHRPGHQRLHHPRAHLLLSNCHRTGWSSVWNGVILDTLKFMFSIMDLLNDVTCSKCYMLFNICIKLQVIMELNTSCRCVLLGYLFFLRILA